MDEHLLRARVGRVLGGTYRVARLLGSGGMGAVYEARHVWTDRAVAVKLLHPEHVRRREMVSRFMTEARAASAIRHPNIVDVLDMGYDDAERTLYIVQELLRGEDLATRLERERTLGVTAALDLLVPVLGALVSAHRAGIIHRDVKPENVFLATPGRGRRGDPEAHRFRHRARAVGGRRRAHDAGGHGGGHPVAVRPPSRRGAKTTSTRAPMSGRSACCSTNASRGPTLLSAANYNLVVVKIATEAAAPLRELCPAVPAAVAAVGGPGAVAGAGRPLGRRVGDARRGARVRAALGGRHSPRGLAAHTRRGDARAAARAPGLPAPPTLPDDLGDAAWSRRGARWVAPYLAFLAVVAALSVGLIVGRRSAPPTERAPGEGDDGGTASHPEVLRDVRTVTPDDVPRPGRAEDVTPILPP
ncbi:MAG: serine/threonine-protein kinase [Polyangiales bacterium]